MTKRLVQGNEAVLLGAIRAGASYFAGYPISPSSEILAQASQYAVGHPEFRFLQAEDEIASVNAIMGGSLAGAKSFPATSGPIMAKNSLKVFTVRSLPIHSSRVQPRSI